jgi:hypothetical protein
MIAAWFAEVVSNGDVAFALTGVTGLYLVLGLPYFYLVGREITHGSDKEMVPRGRSRLEQQVVARNEEESVPAIVKEAVAANGEGRSL